MTKPDSELEAFGTGDADDVTGDFAGEHDSSSHAGEQDDDPGMEPEENTPDSLGGMD